MNRETKVSVLASSIFTLVSSCGYQSFSDTKVNMMNKTATWSFTQSKAYLLANLPQNIFSHGKSQMPKEIKPELPEDGEIKNPTVTRSREKR